MNIITRHIESERQQTSQLGEMPCFQIKKEPKKNTSESASNFLEQIRIGIQKILDNNYHNEINKINFRKLFYQLQIDNYEMNDWIIYNGATVNHITIDFGQINQYYNERLYYFTNSEINTVVFLKII